MRGREIEAMAVEPERASEEEQPIERTRLSSAFRLGLLVLIVLAVLTVIEYAVAVGLDDGNLPYLVIRAVLKAGIIVYYFMHVYQLWRQEE